MRKNDLYDIYGVSLLFSSLTFCPLCNAALVFARPVVDGQRLTFGTSGNLRHSDLIMWDRQTETWWQQFTGDGIVSELTGRRLADASGELKVVYDAIAQRRGKLSNIMRAHGLHPGRRRRTWICTCASYTGTEIMPLVEVFFEPQVIRGVRHVSNLHNPV